MTNVRFLPVASGSRGNCTFIATAHCNVLVDCGISPRRLFAALREHGIAPESIDALFITHTHSDHISGLPSLLKRITPRIYCHEDLRGQLMRLAVSEPGLPFGGAPEFVTFRSGEGFHYRDMDVLPVAVSHDCDPTVMFKFYCAGRSMGLLTDLGIAGEELLRIYGDCDLLLLESNHCPKMLMGGRYPEMLKRRIHGQRGHLSNDQAVTFATGLASMPRHLLLGHLSENNNTPQVASAAFSRIETGFIPHSVVEQGVCGPCIEL